MSNAQAEKTVLATYFDSNYLYKAVATYLSLSKHLDNFVMYAFCFDDLSFEVISGLGYENFVAISHCDFETNDLKKTKREKIKLYEYYWTCHPYLIKWLIEKTKAKNVTFIDCDFMFFSNPKSIFDEARAADVLLQPNNFSIDEVKQFIPVGYYCACWETFKNNKNGRGILKWWIRKCFGWCFARFEDNKFGEQKYLDDWRTRFKNVREVTQIGAGVAPWNIQKYDVSKTDDKILINNQWPLIYYHYHGFKMNLMNYSYIITGDRENYYRISAEAVKTIYKPYVLLTQKIIKDLKKRFLRYKQFAELNPESNIKLVNGVTAANFASYKINET